MQLAEFAYFWGALHLFLELCLVKDAPVPLLCRYKLDFVDCLEEIHANRFHHPLTLNLLASKITTSPKTKLTLEGTKGVLNPIARFRYELFAQYFAMPQRTTAGRF